MKMKILTLVVLFVAAPLLAQQPQNWSRVARGTSLPATVWPSGYLYFRTADSTLHSSTGTTWRQINKVRDIIELRAEEWIGTSANGAQVDTVSDLAVMLFDTATAETLSTSIFLPDWFSSIDSLVIEIGANSTAGDSASFGVQWLGRAFNESLTTAYSAALRDTVDLGTTANAMKRMLISGSFTNLAAKDRVKLKVFRDTSIANDEAGDVYFIAMRVYGKGLQ